MHCASVHAVIQKDIKHESELDIMSTTVETLYTRNIVCKFYMKQSGIISETYPFNFSRYFGAQILKYLHKTVCVNRFKRVIQNRKRRLTIGKQSILSENRINHSALFFSEANERYARS